MLFLADQPMASSIRLSAGNGEDGILQVGEIFDLAFEAEIVVASACQTAVGKIYLGDEIVGLTRAFLYAGANAVLSSLWNISDEATAELMTKFYSKLRFGYVEALRQAQLYMVQSDNYNHPFYWAAFNMTGGF
jgi:CHAT domain-containing protein